MNPKDIVGQTKPNLFLIPSSSTIHTALAFMDGAKKYGPYNWRINKVDASTYIAAAKRQIESWVDGEETSSDANVHHLAHAIASLAIIIDAQECDTLNDDRPPEGFAANLIRENTKNVK